MKTVLLVMTVVGAAALMALAGAMPAGAHNTPFYYANVVIDIMDYRVDQYNDFDLVRMKVSIENLDSSRIVNPHFRLGSDTEAGQYHVAYADVRGKGGDVSVNDCTSADRFGTLSVGNTGETNICFMLPKTFGDPQGLKFSFDSEKGHGGGDNHNLHADRCDSSGSHSSHSCSLATQVIPFHEESAYCFVEHPDYCNANNIQRIDGTPAPRPTLEPEPEPEPATLLYTIYHNQTGVLTLVFDDLVVAHNPGRIHLIHDIDTYIDDGTAPDLGDAELDTVDNKRQSMMLAFTLPDVVRLQVTESLRAHGDLVLLIDTHAVYAAEGFVDITSHTNSPILVPDIIVVR